MSLDIEKFNDYLLSSDEDIVNMGYIMLNSVLDLNRMSIDELTEVIMLLDQVKYKKTGSLERLRMAHRINKVYKKYSKAARLNSKMRVLGKKHKVKEWKNEG